MATKWTWTKINRINIEKCFKAVSSLYKELGLKEPEVCIYCESPSQALKVIPVNVVCHFTHCDFASDIWSQYDRVKKKPKLMSLLLEIAKEGHIIWTFSNAIVLVDRPVKFHYNNNNVLHRDNGPAIEYSDGTGIYASNGAFIPWWILSTSEAKLDPHDFYRFSNAEYRRAFVNRIGLERLCYSLKAKTIDKDSFTNLSGTFTYELKRLKVDDEYWQYLQMENASLPEIYHVEGVPNECETVKEALNFRNGLKPEQIDDINGESWYQQGDVILRPKGKAKYKSFPDILT